MKYLVGTKKVSVKPYEDMKEPSIYITKWKKPFRRVHVLHTCTARRSPSGKAPTESVNTWAVARGWRGGMNRWNTRLSGQWKYSTWHCYDACTSSHTYSRPNPKNGRHRVNPHVKYGLGVMACQRRFSDGNTSLTMVGDVDSGGRCVGRDGTGVPH